MTLFNQKTGQGDNIVILHGWGATHKWMQPIVDQLSNRHCTINFDLPGRGQSHWQAGTKTIDEIADQLLPYLPSQATYIGWSFGGLISFSIAARYPEKVKRIIGIGTTPKFIEDQNWPGFPKPGFLSVFKPAVEENGFANVFKGFWDIEFDEFNPKPENYHKIMSIMDDDPTPDLNILFEGMHICDSTDLRQAIQAINCPIDLIFGSNDDNVPVAAHDKIKALIPHMNMHVIDGAHYAPFYTHPEQFNRILLSITGEK